MGWAPIGLRAETKGNYLRGVKYSTCAAVAFDGIVAHWTIEKGFDAETFQSFMENYLIPNTNPFPQSRSVIVMDNAPIHKKELTDLLSQFRRRLVFLPPYCPKLSPIEIVFSKVKKALRRQALESTLRTDDLFKQAVETISATDTQGFFRHCGYI